MSAPNFRTMENFPLFLLDTDEMSWLDVQFLMDDLKPALDNMNDDLMFHEISVESGYYTGLQFYVEELHDPNDYDNEDCHYYFDSCRSVAIRKFDREINKINRMLRDLAADYGFEQYYCSARFSNGEAWYSKVQNTVRSRVRQAVSPVC